MVDQTRASFRGAILRFRRKKEIESKHRAGPGRNEGNKGAGGSRVLPMQLGLRGREGKREKGPSCSRPRNNVSGLWFFIRARSHNGGSQNDPSTRDRTLLSSRTRRWKKSKKKTSKKKRWLLFPPWASLDATCHFFMFLLVPLSLSRALSLPFSFVSPSFLSHLSLLPLSCPTLRYSLPRLMPFVSRKRD